MVKTSVQTGYIVSNLKFILSIKNRKGIIILKSKRILQIGMYAGVEKDGSESYPNVLYVNRI
ncbi:hypothetical protein COJ42_29630 [Bacillus cereus]|nr:hypothetical protein CN464_20265 [Bacillus cereus]PFM25441.1 hypothetical protein COJ42_29630 [Bacillus cereus]PFP91986.1 hypothetical protein COK02_13110 [Bacillus cereus]PGN54446.1 hypothetical protein CN966_20590 [Bacillus cereus]